MAGVLNSISISRCRLLGLELRLLAAVDREDRRGGTFWSSAIDLESSPVLLCAGVAIPIARLLGRGVVSVFSSISTRVRLCDNGRVLCSR